MSINRNMFDHSGWHQIPCAQRDPMVQALHPFSSLTDLDGEYGTPIVYTEWGVSSPDRAVLRDYRWPNSGRVCEHWVPDAGEELSHEEEVEE